MIVSFLCLLVSFSRQSPAQDTTAYVVSIVSETTGDDVSLRFVLTAPPGSYSAVRDGDEIVVRIEAEALPGLSLPAPRDAIRSVVLGSEGGFSVRVALSEDRTHEIVRELSSLRLVLHPLTPAEAPSPRPMPTLAPLSDPLAGPSPTPEQTPTRSVDPVPADTADLYRRLFPSTNDPSVGGVGPTQIGEQQNWYSDFTWLGIQARPWVSVSYVDGKTTQPESNTVTSDSYWVIQPNLGLGFSPALGGSREGQWKINYTPRFRRLQSLNLPRLASHFFDAGLDQPVAAFGSFYGNYHFSTGVLETDEVDPGREYGIGLNRVVDTSLERFHRNSFSLGIRFDAVAETSVDVNVGKTSVRYGNVAADAPYLFGERAFFDYDTQTLNAQLRRGLGEGRLVSLLFNVHDTPAQKERVQVEGRGYTYGASLEGEIAALTTGRVMFGYRTQKNPSAGEGGQNYKDITYGAQLVRELSEDTTLGLGADRKLYLSAYEDNGFYVADSLRGDLNTQLPFAFFLRGSAGLQSNNYEASPQVSETTGELVLRKDRIGYWSVGLTRSVTSWAYLRFDYTSERRNSNLDRFNVRTRALTFQLGLGFFGQPGSQSQSSW
jgi:hypothetical protein